MRTRRAEGASTRRPGFALLALGLLLGVTTLAGIPPAAASKIACPGTISGLAPRVGYAGATVRGEDASVMYVPVAPTTRSQVYMRVVGEVATGGTVSFSYAFHNVSGYSAGTLHVLACDAAPLSGDTFTFEDVPAGTLIVLERPVLFSQQHLVVDLHLRAEGFTALAWEAEVRSCAGGLC